MHFRMILLSSILQSPWPIHLILDCWCQYISSRFQRCFSSSLSFASSYIVQSQLPIAVMFSFWVASLLSLLLLPNNLLLHLSKAHLHSLSLCRIVLYELDVCVSVYVSLTTYPHSLISSHISSNQNCLGPFPSLKLAWITCGEWFDPTTTSEKTYV